MSSIVLKWIMALSGAAMSAFLVGHLSGNFLLYAGQDAFNAYAAQMQSLGPLLWLARAGLLAFLVAHVTSAILLSKRNRAARPVRYMNDATIQASFASRSMMYSGLLILFFVLYHLAHFTLHWIHPEFAGGTDAAGRHDVFQMVVLSFRHPLTSLFYVLSIVFLGLHLNHAIQSVIQTLGVSHNYVARVFRCYISPLFSGAVALGFISLPIAVLLNIIHL